MLGEGEKKSQQNYRLTLCGRASRNSGETTEMMRQNSTKTVELLYKTSSYGVERSPTWIDGDLKGLERDGRKSQQRKVVSKNFALAVAD